MATHRRYSQLQGLKTEMGCRSFAIGFPRQLSTARQSLSGASEGFMTSWLFLPPRHCRHTTPVLSHVMPFSLQVSQSSACRFIPEASQVSHLMPTSTHSLAFSCWLVLANLFTQNLQGTRKSKH